MFICESDVIKEGQLTRLDILFRGKPASILIFRYLSDIKAYLNVCVHMPRTLDCENGDVFFPEQHHLRCSMHGIVYAIDTGESLSEICRGKKLTPIRIEEIRGKIIVTDKRVEIVKPTTIPTP